MKHVSKLLSLEFQQVPYLHIHLLKEERRSHWCYKIFHLDNSRCLHLHHLLSK